MLPKFKSKQEAQNYIFRFTLCLSLVGIVVAISIPNCPTCTATRPRQPEAKAYIGVMNRSQQAYFLENKVFANSFTNMRTETDTFKYFTKVEEKILTPDYEISIVKSYSQPRQQNLYSYFGTAWAAVSLQKNKLVRSESINNYILCKTSNSNLIPSSASQVEFSADFKTAFCPKGMEEIEQRSIY